MPAANKNEKQIMDVSKPGKSAPSATAKPIIVGHGPMVQDPMVTADTNPEAAEPVADKVEEPVIASPSASKKIISPITEDKTEPVEAATIEQAETSDDEAETATQSEEAVVVDAIIDQVESKIPATSDEDKKKYELIDKMIAEKKYFVPLGKVNGKSNRSLLGIIALLLGLIVAFVVLLDMGVIKMSFNAPTDFFPDKTSKTLPPVEAEITASQPTTIVDHDAERQADINAIHGQVEAFYAQNGRYPTLDNMNDKAFRSANFRNLQDATLGDPEGTDALLVSVPKTKAYSYAAQKQGGGTCDNVTDDCAQYTLSATLRSGTYTKQNLN